MYIHRCPQHPFIKVNLEHRLHLLNHRRKKMYGTETVFANFWRSFFWFLSWIFLLFSLMMTWPRRYQMINPKQIQKVNCSQTRMMMRMNHYKVRLVVTRTRVKVVRNQRVDANQGRRINSSVNVYFLEMILYSWLMVVW